MRGSGSIKPPRRRSANALLRFESTIFGRCCARATTGGAYAARSGRERGHRYDSDIILVFF